jgi:SAM-dependent methyltransferase
MLRNMTSWICRRFMGTRNYEALTVAETFRRIYRSGAWGGGGERFYSGSGSRGSCSEDYCASVIQFIREHQVESVVDLGCGDFSVGGRITEATRVRYTGIDVVPELIEHLRSTVHDPLISFQCADITVDRLPAADLCLIRQVLQHLSNDEISRVLANLGGFSHVLFTEHLPLHPVSINRDKPHGPDIRERYGSGVYLEQQPFSLPVVEVWKYPLNQNSILKTVLLRQDGNRIPDAAA